MRIILSILFVITIILTVIYFNSSEQIKTSAAPNKTNATTAYGKIPLSFERNEGQTDAQVKFLSRGAGYALFLTEREAVLKLRADNCKTDEKNCESKSGVLRIGFDGANSQPQISGANEQTGKSNYLNLDGTGEKITNVPNFERVQYKEIYAGVDLVFYGNERQLEYDFNIAPHTDPHVIKLGFEGTENLSIDANGNLVARVAGKGVKFTAPVAYQIVSGERHTVEAKYIITEQSKIAFALGEYDESQTLVIDPILQYSSYLGGDSSDYGNSITVNAAGEAYVAGQTYSPNFPIANAIQVNLNAPADGFLTKFNASGTGVIFSTYLGGPEGQSIDGIALDAGGNIALTGTDTRNMNDVFVGRLNPNGSALVHPTVFIGGSGIDEAEGLDLDAAGNAYITGSTDSTNFPTTAGVIQPNDGQGMGAFALRVNSNGAIGYSTYLDGVNDNQGSDLAVDGAGNAYITGSHDNASGVRDVFILKLNPTGSALVYPTFYFGGSRNDSPADIEIDDDGNAYIGGSTFSDNFPTTTGVVQPTFGGNTMFLDGFAAKVNASGNALIWATYLGGISSENVRSLNLDSAGGVYVTGNLTTTGDSNFYVVHLNGTATALDYNAQFGGTDGDFVEALAIDPNNDIYLTGYTSSNNYPTTAGALDRTYSGTTDGFIMKIAAPDTPGSTVINVNVPGNSVLNNEKFVVQLNAGDQVTINNISGQVNFDSIDNVPGCTYVVNANGLNREVYNTNQTGCYNNEWTPNDPLPGANQGHAGLYMMRGAAKTFIGLNGTTFTATANQSLYLGVNDVPFTGGPDGGAPNTGSFNARVTVTPASSQTSVLNVSVPGNSVPGNEKFVAQLNAGDQVIINNISGQVDFDSQVTGNCPHVVNANGLNRADYDDPVNRFCWLNEWTPNDPLQGANHGHAGLYIMRGTQKTFIGLNGTTFTATAAQPLYLGTNDGGTSPNSGSFNARVTIVRPATTTINVNVPGNSVPNNEKFVVHLNTGDEVTINNISGQVNFNPQGQTNGCPYSTNANGLDRVVYDDPGNQLICYYSEWSPNHLDPLLGANHGHAGLYMMRGNQKTFIGLNGSTFTATTAQPLYLGINDGGTDPNTGSFNARVTINRAATVEPTLSANTITIQEGNSGTTNATFTVSLSPESNKTVTVRYQTANGTATAGQDYTATGGTLTFAPGETSKTVNVPVIGDTTDEPDEFFTLQLINPTNAQTVFPRGRANITDDDSVPSIIVSNASVTEGNSGTTNATFVVSLSGVSGNNVTVNYATANGTATAPADYAATSGTLTFAPGTTSKPVTVPIVGDTLVEANETFTLNLSAPTNATIADASGLGTINNDDVGGTIQFSAAAVSVNEGAGSITLTVNRTGGAASGVSVNYATQNGTATAPQDYTATSGSLSFGAGEASKTFIVPITNDTIVEGNEAFSINLSSPTGGATLGSPSSVTVTIIDNDSCNYSLNPTSQNFAASGGTGTIAVTAQTGCNWTATESATWITITGGANGSGNGTVTFTVAANTGAARTDTITVGGQTFTVNQAAGCTYSLNPVSVNVGSGVSNGSFQITTQTGCSWTAASQASWLTITSAANGSGTAAISYSVAANTGAARTGTITVGGQTFTVNQAAATGRRTSFDFDGDSKTDLSIFRPSGGEWWYLKSSNGANAAFQFGLSTDKIIPADYTGDSKTDVAFYRNGQWFIMRSEDLTFYAFPFGNGTDTPVPADYDGDGKADPAVFRPSNSTWFIQKSSGGTDIMNFGASGDKPVVADYDGDGKADLAIFRPTGTNGAEWWIRRSSNGSVFAVQFGTSTDKAVQGDYTGDGKADIVFWRPSNGQWFVLRSEDFSFYAFPFGASGDIPAPGDYDGDGKVDAAVFRSSNATWYINRSTAGVLIQQFGINGDLPVPNAFVP